MLWKGTKKLKKIRYIRDKYVKRLSTDDYAQTFSSGVLFVSFPLINVILLEKVNAYLLLTLSCNDDVVAIKATVVWVK